MTDTKKQDGSDSLHELVGGCFMCAICEPTFSYTESGKMRIKCEKHGEIIERYKCTDRISKHTPNAQNERRLQAVRSI